MYEYRNKGQVHYFYKKENQEIKPLIYKLFLTEDKNVRRNETFKQQIYNDLKCSSITLKKAESLKYKSNSLINIFKAYNDCKQSDYINYVHEKKNEFHLTPQVGIDYHSLSIENSRSYARSGNYDSIISLHAGLELEYILPFYKNTWSLFIRPSFQQYKNEKQTYTGPLFGGGLTGKVNYKSIELPIGIRYYFHFPNDSKLFLNFAIIYDHVLNSSIEFIRNNGTYLDNLKIYSNMNMSFGAGYQFKKISLEFIVKTPRRILNGYQFWSSSYRTGSLIIGYKIF